MVKKYNYIYITTDFLAEHGKNFEELELEGSKMGSLWW